MANKRLEAEQDLRHDLVDALSDSALILSERRLEQRDPETLMHQFDNLARQLISQIGEERERISKLAAQREQEYGTLSNFTPKLETSTQQIALAAETMHAAHADHSQMMSDALQALRSSQTELTSRVVLAEETISNNLIETEKAVSVKLLQTQHEITTSLREAQQGFTSGAQQLSRQAIDLVQQSQQALTRDLRQLHSEMSGALTTSQQEFIAEMSQSQSTLLENISHAQQELFGTLLRSQEGLASSIDGLAAPIQLFSEQQDQLLRSNQQVSGQLNTLAGQQQEWGETLRRTMDTLQASALGLREHTNHAVEVANHVSVIAATIVAAQAKMDESHALFLSGLSQERAEQSQLARLVSEANMGMEAALEEVRNSAQLLHSVAIHLDDLVSVWSAGENPNGHISGPERARVATRTGPPDSS
jgi:uncharacterized phage infection (PIP) family protein YhgE